MKTTMNRTLRGTLALISVLLTLGVSKAAAGLIEVDQVIWGMDCAPCAYGMERGLKKLKGVKQVKVSLNKGNAVVEFAADSKLALADIRRVVRDGGFTPKEAKLKVSGTLKSDGDELGLEVGKVSYTLELSDKAKDAWQRLREAVAGAIVTVVGDAPADQDDQIIVQDVKE